MEKHLVIGASGQLGIELTLGMQARYGIHAVVASDIRQSTDAEVNRSEFILLDASDAHAVRKVLTGCVGLKYEVTHQCIGVCQGWVI